MSKKNISSYPDGFSEAHSLALAEPSSSVLLAFSGGADSTALLHLLLKECQKYGAKLYLPPLKLCGDNAAMIASQGYFEYKKGVLGGTDLNAYATKSV